MRDQLMEVVAQVEPCTVVVEACTGAFYWARRIEALGHQVKIISPAIREAICASPEERW